MYIISNRYINQNNLMKFIYFLQKDKSEICFYYFVISFVLPIYIFFYQLNI